MDWWPGTGGSTSNLVEIFDIVLSWECLPFCLLNKDLFKKSFQSGENEYCSAALVKSLCSLATVLAADTLHDIHSQNSATKMSLELGESLARGAAGALLDKASCLNIADSQALGVLSLYHISRGQRSNAQKLAKDFVRAATELSPPPLSGDIDDAYTRTRASTYCGAISLNR